MRRFLFLFVSLLFLVIVGGTAALYLFRDQILLHQLRSRAGAFAPWEIKLSGLETKVLGPFSVTLHHLELGKKEGGDAVQLRIASARASSPLTILGLYQAFTTKSVLPLTVELDSPQVQLPLPQAKASEKGAAPPPPWPSSLDLPLMPPLRLTLSWSKGGVSGAYRVENSEAKVNAHLNARAGEVEGQISGGFAMAGAEASLPADANFKLSLSSQKIKIDHLGLKAAGIEAKSSGEIDLAPVVAKFQLEASAPDLSRVSLRAEDKAALGLAALPSGSFLAKIAGVASNGALKAGGRLSLSDSIWQLRLPEKTIFAKAAEGSRIEGKARLKAEAPSFLLEFPLLGQGQSRLSGNLEAALDLTEALVAKAGQLEKPAGVPLRAELSAKLEEKGIQVERLFLLFHTIQLQGSGALSQPLGKLVSGTFKAEAKSLAGLPALLPVLREKNEAGASLSEAQGSFVAEGRIRLLPQTPAQSLVEFRSLTAKGVRLPLAYRKDKISAQGLLLANIQGTGKYDAGSLELGRSSGSADLSSLQIEMPGFMKKSGRKLLLQFDASGTPTRVQLRKLALQADGLDASLSGTVSTAKKGRADLSLAATAKAELGPLREYLPKLPVKISGGSFGLQAKVGGAWLLEGGIEKSPLSVSGSTTAKLGAIVMPESAASADPAAAKTEPAPLLPPWPVARSLRLSYRAELASFQRGKLEAKGITAEGKLEEGKFLSQISVASTFGGSARLTNLAGNLTQVRLPLSGRGSVEGMNLSLLAGFVDPSYGEIVKGTLKATAAFSVPDFWSEQLMQNSRAEGEAEIRQGYVSTASIDSMLNAKLAGIPGLGDKAKVKTGGLAADMRTRFKAENGVVHLTDFVGLTPKKDEMKMNGTLDLAFNADMKGEARLVDAPVRGAVGEANSDEQGRLIVPFHFRGNLKNPSVDIANDIIEKMLAKTATREAQKLKDKAVEEGKKKLEAEKKKVEDSLKDAGKGLLKGLFKR